MAHYINRAYVIDKFKETNNHYKKYCENYYYYNKLLCSLLQWECKLVTSLWQYFIVANYTWILMEGLYLHNLIFMAPFSDSSSIMMYILLGWGKYSVKSIAFIQHATYIQVVRARQI